MAKQKIYSENDQIGEEGQKRLYAMTCGVAFG